MYTAKQAYLIKERIPEAKVTVCYIDVRAFGKGYEEFYERVQKEGVIYRRGSVSEIYKRDGSLVVRAEDTLLGELFEEEADLVVLATGLVPRKDVRDLTSLLKISQSSDGFLLEKHPKLDPVATMNAGVFVAGCCQGPKDIPDTVAQASAAAAEVLAMIGKGEVEAEAATAEVDETLCRGCGLCVAACPYGARELNEERIAEVVEALCQGCGVCAAVCPSGASSIKHFTKQEIVAEIDGILV